MNESSVVTQGYLAEEKPVGLASHSLSKAIRHYSHIDKEAIVIICGGIKVSPVC